MYAFAWAQGSGPAWLLIGGLTVHGWHQWTATHHSRLVNLYAPGSCRLGHRQVNPNPKPFGLVLELRVTSRTPTSKPLNLEPMERAIPNPFQSFGSKKQKPQGLLVAVEIVPGPKSNIRAGFSSNQSVTMVLLLGFLTYETWEYARCSHESRNKENILVVMTVEQKKTGDAGKEVRYQIEFNSEASRRGLLSTLGLTALGVPLAAQVSRRGIRSRLQRRLFAVLGRLG